MGLDEEDDDSDEDDVEEEAEEEDNSAMDWYLSRRLAMEILLYGSFDLWREKVLLSKPLLQELLEEWRLLLEAILKAFDASGL